MKGLLCALLLVMLCACSKPREELFEGTISEIRIDTLAITSKDRVRLDFLVAGAEMVHFEGLVEGAPVKVTYREKLSKNRANPALRIEVNPTYARLMGHWIEVGDGARAYGMGIALLPRGEAHSIGMQTMLFKSWRLTPQGNLWLAGHSLGNGQTIAVEDEWRIVRLTDEELTLALEELTLHFCRETEADREARRAREESSTTRGRR